MSSSFSRFAFSSALPRLLTARRETPVGYALFKASSKKVKEGFIVENDPVQDVVSKLKLKEFHKFDSAATALEQAAALVEGKVTPRLSSLLDSIKDETKASLAVADPKLGNVMSQGIIVCRCL